MRNNILKTKKAILVASALSMAGASGASLAGPVTAWNYVNDASFTAATFTTGGSGTTNGATLNPDYELSWGADGGSFVDPPTIEGRSAVTIGNGTSDPVTLTDGGPATGSVNTVIGAGPPIGDEIGIGINISHWNNAIWSGYNTLLSGTMHDTLTLTPTAGGSPIDLPPLDFKFQFLETPNAGPCPGGTAPLCGDLFGLLPISTLNLPFQYEGNDYLASILVSDGMGGAAPIGSLLDGECDALFGPGHAGCQGWRTDEGAITTVQFGFAISTEPLFVPEPASLALIGLGLFGLGYGRYKTRLA